MPEFKILPCLHSLPIKLIRPNCTVIFKTTQFKYFIILFCALHIQIFYSFFVKVQNEHDIFLVEENSNCFANKIYSFILFTDPARCNVNIFPGAKAVEAGSVEVPT